MKIPYFLLSLLMPFLVQGQKNDSILITKNFKFQDGIYSTFEAWQHNQPTLLWKDVEANVVTNPLTLLTQIEHIKDKKEGKNVDIGNMWGVVIDGIPYIQLPNVELHKSLFTFSGMVVRGKLCYFAYESEQPMKMQMSAYNPVNGRPFRTKDVELKRKQNFEKLLYFDSGAIVDFTLTEFKKAIEEDKSLLSSVEDLKPKEVREKLFKCLLIYNDRNPVFVR